MNFSNLELRDAILVEPKLIEDDRGFFSRIWCKEEFLEFGIDMDLVQCNISYNKVKDTLRGMHYQKYPYEEGKIVFCNKGAIYDVIIDIRPKSVTYMKWVSIVLSSENHKMVYIPKGFAHGFQTLEDDTEVGYLMTEYYRAESSTGIRWDDPLFNIKWPEASNRVISDKDKSWKDFVI